MSEVLVVLRCFNDVRVVGETLDGVYASTGPRPRVVAIDSGSSDGSVDVLKKFPLQLIQIPLGTYVPGRVLNLGMRQGTEPFAAFVNSDATPQNRAWLEKLLEPLSGERVAAAYGRQVARPDAHPLVVKDYERAFGDGSVAATWRHFFSMASSAIRRDVWEENPFDEAIKYSEDVYWTWQLRRKGWQIAYAKDSVAMHSHDYTLPEMRKRYAGEGKADAAIYPPEMLEAGFVTGALKPWAAEVVRDLRWAAGTGSLRAALDSPVHRWVQRTSYLRGLREGLGLG
jgi:rhamnosyltransferase